MPPPELPEPDHLFTEYTVFDMIEALVGLPPGAIISVEVQDPDGATVLTGLVRLHLVTGNGHDGKQPYQFVDIIARADDPIPDFVVGDAGED